MNLFKFLEINYVWTPFAVDVNSAGGRFSLQWHFTVRLQSRRNIQTDDRHQQRFLPKYQEWNKFPSTATTDETEEI